MKPFRKYTGMVLGYVLWLPIYCLLRFTTRTRVLVVLEDEILLIQSWLNTGVWSCPGGGIHRHELPVIAVVRELREETGIIADPQNLQDVGLMKQTKGRAHAFHGFILKLDDRPRLEIQLSEVAAAEWVKSTDIKNRRTEQHVELMLNKWQKQR